MIQVPYEFYAANYRGQMIPEYEWKRILIKSNTYLNSMMHQTPDENDLELVQLCLCEISELIYQEEKHLEKSNGREVLSENNDGYSVTYAGSDKNPVNKKIYAVIRRYLASTGLLYAGVC